MESNGTGLSMESNSTELSMESNHTEFLVKAEWLCGSQSVFFNSTMSWYTESPSLSDCFLNTQHSTLPILAIIIFLPIQISALRRTTARQIPLKLIGILKVVSTIIFGLLPIISLCSVFFNDDQTSLIGIVEPLLRIALSLFILALQWACRARGQRTSWLQFFFWILYTLSSALVSVILFLKEDQGGFKVTLAAVVAVVALANLILQFFIEPKPKYGETPLVVHKNACPEEEAPCPSKLLFSWFTPLGWTGYKRDLTPEDLWDIKTSLSSKRVVAKFNRFWTNTTALLHSNGGEGKDKIDGEPQVVFANNEKSGSLKKRLLWSLIRAFGPMFICGSLLKLSHDIFLFFSPILLRLIIRFAADFSQPIWKGLFFAALLLVTTSMQTMFLGHYFYYMYKVGLSIRASVISAVYRKALIVSNSARKDVTSGEIVNFMSVDAQRLVDVMPFLNMSWSAPMQICIALGFLWQILGPSVLAGFIFMVILIPVNAFIASKSKKFQIAQMKQKDQRAKIMTEILQGIKVLKLYAWEPSFQEMVTTYRGKEVSILTKIAYLATGSSFIWSTAPFLVSLVSFATYLLVDPEHNLDAEKAFVSLSLFNILRFPLSMLPMLIAGLVQASVSLKRLQKFFDASEIDSDAVTKEQKNVSTLNSIEVKNASFSWDTSEKDESKATVKNINLDLPQGSLTAIVGGVGSSKSSLLASLLGELHKLSGTVTLRGKVAFVAQQAWVQNDTLRNNILFGKAFNEQGYNNVLENCSLKKDLDVLPNNDQTEIGEKGINLSGGQKQRISLARAVYNDADIYLLDDPLSAVDAHVGKHIFTNVMGPDGSLQNKTRVWVTHILTFLPYVDRIVVMKDGKISEMGTYKELLEKKGEFSEYLLQRLSEEEEQELEEDEEIKEGLEKAMGKEDFSKKFGEMRRMSRQRTMSEASRKSVDIKSSPASHEGSPLKEVSKGIDNGSSPTKNGDTVAKESTEMTKVPGEKKVKKQYEEEKMAKGNVSARVYWYYIQCMGVATFSACIISHALMQIFSTLTNLWLSAWSDDVGEDKLKFGRDTYLLVYGLLGLGQALGAGVGSLLLYLSTLSGARYIHNTSLNNLMRSPMAFFDVTPQGRILNRFGKDVDVLDSTMPMILRGWITCVYSVMATLFVVMYTTPEFIFPITVIMVGYYMVQRIYVSTSRQLKRIESTTRSPIYSHFGETVSGVQTIRAYGVQREFIATNEAKVDANHSAMFPGIVANRWLAMRLEMVGNLIAFTAASLAVLSRGSVTPGLIGLSVTYATSVTQTLNWIVRMTSEVETNIVAVERLKEYSELEQEDEWEKKGDKLDKEWPKKGEITFDSYSTRYREGLDLVLNKLSFKVPGGQRVGIVGRTGAGKSSMTLALLRVMEASSGRILIDDLDISTLGLHELRRKVTMIPQDPVLFSGTLRMNLDPFNKATDLEIWEALAHSHLKEYVSSLSEGLDHNVSEGGDNLSVGQRQLLCLARALLRKSKILVLDEATAAIDMETDELVQTTIKEEFKDCTVLTIAHRINTILDYDKVLVLAFGKMKEYGEPQKLLKDSKSDFYAMCKEANLI